MRRGLGALFLAGAPVIVSMFLAGHASATGPVVSVAPTATVTAVVTAPILKLPAAPTIVHASLSLPSVAASTQRVLLNVTLDQPAGSNGLAVPLVSSVPSALSVPASLQVLAGKTSAATWLTTGTVASTTPVQISANMIGAYGAATVVVQPPPQLAGMTLATSGPVDATNPAVATVRLTAPSIVPVNVAIGVLPFALTVPSFVTIPAGASSATFTAPATYPSQMTFPASAVLTARLGSTTLSAPAVTVVKPPAPSSTASAPSIDALGVSFLSGGGGAAFGAVTLSGYPTGGATVALSSTSSQVHLRTPTSIFVPAYEKSALFVFDVDSVGAATAASITATVGGSTKTASFTIPPVAVQSLAFVTPDVYSWQPAAGVVTLAAPAPSGGRVVSLATREVAPSGYVLTVPSSITVAPGQSQASFSVSYGGFPRVPVDHPFSVYVVENSALSATVTVHVRMLNDPNKPTVHCDGTDHFGNDTGIPVGDAWGTSGAFCVDFPYASTYGARAHEVVNASIGLTTPAPPGGMTVALSCVADSGQTMQLAVPTFPSTVFIPAGQQSVSFQVTADQSGVTWASCVFWATGPNNAITGLFTEYTPQ